jgi:hypothetical protein
MLGGAAAVQLDGAEEPGTLVVLAAPIESSGDPTSGETQLNDIAAVERAVCQAIVRPAGPILQLQRVGVGVHGFIVAWGPRATVVLRTERCCSPRRFGSR